ncbi:hypothetical protein M9434_000345 [Picochlorum sp. BPE23]|nr:hypothetical protein M9434_000345 [Picochlorum sp. BPE23]
MVKKNKFIDKKNARTYALVYQSGEKEEGGGRVLYEQQGQRRDDVEEEMDDRPRSGHPLSWLMMEDDGERLDEKRRQELIELGFDDDGYDYLQHLRRLDVDGGTDATGHLEEVKDKKGEEEGKLIVSEKKIIEDGGASSSGKRNAGQEVETGVFVKAQTAQPLEEDVALFDASGLTVMQQIDDDESVAGMMGGVTAFSKKTDEVLEKKQYEIGEIENMFKDAEKATEEHERVLGEGDLLDDFILAAAGAETLADNASFDDERDDASFDDDTEAYSSEGEVDLDSNAGHKRPGSIASTYWREEREDRKNLLSVIDERFEHLALEYDEDELGDMEDRADDIEGVADVSEFENILDEFIKDHPKKGDNGGTRSNMFLADEMEKYGFGNEHADVAIQMAKEAIRAAEKAENDPHKPVANGHIDVDPSVFEKDRERWDCESILSLRSNIYNHPGTITEPGVSKGPKTITLNKDGLPVGYVSTGRDFVSVKPTEEEYGLRPKPVVQHIRKKDESAEEKKARKAAVKAARREARATKKELKVLFTKEEQKASKRNARAPVQPSVIM